MGVFVDQQTCATQRYNIIEFNSVLVASFSYRDAVLVSTVLDSYILRVVDGGGDLRGCRSLSNVTSPRELVC